MKADTKPASKRKAWFQVRDYLQSLKKQASPAQKWVLSTLAGFADPNGCNARPSQRTVADITGLDKRTVRKALAYWLAKGVIAKQGEPNKAHGRGICAVYRIVLEKLEKEGVGSVPAGVKEALDVPNSGPEEPQNLVKRRLSVVKGGGKRTLPSLSPTKEKDTESTVLAASPESLHPTLQADIQFEDEED